MKTYLIKSNQTVKATCSNAELAEGALKIVRHDLLQRGITVVCDEPRRFEFYFGWEQTHVTWVIEEVDVLDSLEAVMHQLGL